MAVVSNCNLPEDLYYLVDRHVWARPSGEVVEVGITDVARHLAKTFIAVTPKGVGRKVAKGRNLATVESSKWVGPVPSPVGGEIVEVNEEVVRRPAVLNEDPYGAWIVRIRPDDWAGESAGLVTGPEGIEAYRQLLEREGIVCGEP